MVTEKLVDLHPFVSVAVLSVVGHVVGHQGARASLRQVLDSLEP